MIWGEEDQVFPVELAHRLKRLIYLVFGIIIFSFGLMTIYASFDLSLFQTIRGKQSTISVTKEDRTCD